jgi:hypothetical protein
VALRAVSKDPSGGLRSSAESATTNSGTSSPSSRPMPRIVTRESEDCESRRTSAASSGWEAPSLSARSSRGATRSPLASSLEIFSAVRLDSS